MTLPRSRWRSRSVDLRLLGTAGSLMTLLAGCSSATFQRNVYRSVEDCAADYNQTTCHSRGQQLVNRFLGPVYRLVAGRPSSCNSSDPGAGTFASRRIGIEPVTRGGFGTACRSRTYSSHGTRSRFFTGG